MGGFRNLTDWLEKNDPLFKAGKRATYGMVKNDSDNMEGIGRAMGWDWLEQEGQRNQKNPGRALGKAAATAATFYAGGLLGAGGGAAGNAAGNAAGTVASNAGPVASTWATDSALLAAKQAAEQGAVQSGTAGMNGLLAQEAAREAGIQSLSQIPQGLGTQMSLGNTGYSVQGGLNQATGGLLGGQGGLNSQQAKLGMQGLQMLEGGQEQQQRPMAPPPPPAAPMPPSDFQGYGQQGGPFAGMSEEQKRRILAMLQQGTMR